MLIINTKLHYSVHASVQMGKYYCIEHQNLHWVPIYGRKLKGWFIEHCWFVSCPNHKPAERVVQSYDMNSDACQCWLVCLTHAANRVNKRPCGGNTTLLWLNYAKHVMEECIRKSSLRAFEWYAMLDEVSSVGSAWQRVKCETTPLPILESIWQGQITQEWNCW